MSVDTVTADSKAVNLQQVFFGRPVCKFGIVLIKAFLFRFIWCSEELIWLAGGDLRGGTFIPLGGLSGDWCRHALLRWLSLRGVWTQWISENKTLTLQTIIRDLSIMWVRRCACVLPGGSRVCLVRSALLDTLLGAAEGGFWNSFSSIFASFTYIQDFPTTQYCSAPSGWSYWINTHKHTGSVQHSDHICHWSNFRIS